MAPFFRTLLFCHPVTNEVYKETKKNALWLTNEEKKKKCEPLNCLETHNTFFRIKWNSRLSTLIHCTYIYATPTHLSFFQRGKRDC